VKNTHQATLRSLRLLDGNACIHRGQRNAVLFMTQPNNSTSQQHELLKDVPVMFLKGQ